MADGLTYEQLLALGAKPVDAQASRPMTYEELLAAGAQPATSAPPSAPPVREKVGQGRAAVLGFAQGGTMGFGDELGGAAGSLALKSPVALGPAVQPAPDDTPEVRALKSEILAQQQARPSGYEVLRDRIRQTNNNAKEDNPKTYLGGEVAGGIAGSLIPLGRVAKPLTAAIRGGTGIARAIAPTLGRAAATGAGLGAVAGLGNSEADLTEGAPRELARAGLDAGVGAAVGSVAGVGGYGLAKAAPQVLGYLGRKLEQKGVDAARRVLIDRVPIKSVDLSDEAAREAVKSGAVLPFGTTAGAAKRLETLTETQGALYGRILKDLEAAGVQGPRALELAHRIALEGTDMADNTLNEAVVAKYLDRAEQIVQKAAGERLGLGQAESLKRSAQAAAKYGPREETEINEANKRIAAFIREAVEESVAEGGAAAPQNSAVREMAESFVPVKQRYGRLAQASEVAEEGARRAANRSGGLASKIATMGAAATGDIGAAAQAGIGTRVWQSILDRVPSTAAAGGFHGGRGLQALGGAAARFPGRGTAGYQLGAAAERALLPSSGEALLPRNEEELRQRALIQALLADLGVR